MVLTRTCLRSWSIISTTGKGKKKRHLNEKKTTEAGKAGNLITEWGRKKREVYFHECKSSRKDHTVASSQ